MTVISPCVKACTDLPKFDGFVSWARNEIIAIKDKIYITDIMVVPVESLATNVIII